MQTAFFFFCTLPFFLKRCRPVFFLFFFFSMYNYCLRCCFKLEKVSNKRGCAVLTRVSEVTGVKSSLSFFFFSLVKVVRYKVITPIVTEREKTFFFFLIYTEFTHTHTHNSTHTKKKKRTDWSAQQRCSIFFFLDHRSLFPPLSLSFSFL